MRDEDQSSDSIRDKDNRLLSDYHDRITSEFFKEDHKTVNWEMIIVELTQMKGILQASASLSLDQQREWQDWINVWERNTKAAHLFQADPQGRNMLSLLYRLELKILLAAMHKTSWDKAWEEHKNVRTFLRQTNFVSNDLRNLGAYRCDELLTKLKSAHEATKNEHSKMSDAVSTRSAETTSATFTESDFAAVRRAVLKPRDLESLLDTARDPQERDGIYEKLRLRQEETKRELERLSRNLRLHWGGSTVLKPTLTPEHKTKRFEQLVEVQNKLRSAWDVWLADSRRLDQTRRKALATGTAAADLMQLRLDLLVAQLAHKEAHILALESKYEWYQNNEMRGRVAQELFDGRNTARLLKEQIRDARRRVESRD